MKNPGSTTSNNRRLPGNEQLELIATTAFGLEAIAAREIKALGYEVLETENGRITFQGPPEAICRANLWLRTAERVLLKVGNFKARSFEELFEKTKTLPWSRWIPENGVFPVSGKSIKSQLHSVPDCQAIVKKAVVESLKKTYRTDWFIEKGSQYAIEVALLKDEVTLTIDTSGSGLHRRGYRESYHQAPLKETLAAALVMLSYWNPDRVLVDPLCGSGTIPIEAALIGKNIAPGMHRDFASQHWEWMDQAHWRQARTETHDLADLQRPLSLQGYDLDENAIKMARQYAFNALGGHEIHFERRDVAEFGSRYHYGCIITNPPYGERMGSVEEVEQLYATLSDRFMKLDTWSVYVLTAYPEFERIFGKRADRRRKLYNGRIMCQYYQYQGPRPPRRDQVLDTEREDAE